MKHTQNLARIASLTVFCAGVTRSFSAEPWEADRLFWLNMDWVDNARNQQERVNSFLVEMGQRISVGELVLLPMSRQDIADYLGLTIETVSRTFTGLVSTSTIKVPSSRIIMLRDRSALERGSGAQVAL